MAVEKIKILGAVFQNQLPATSYQLNSTTNLAHLPRNQANWAALEVLFSW